MPPRKADPDGEANVVVVGAALDRGEEPPQAALRSAARHLLIELEREAPGRSVEVRVVPVAAVQVVDAGDIACTPYDIETAVTQIEAAAEALLAEGSHLVAVGGDHTVALPLLRATARRHGPVALVHFDAHLDTWDTYFGQRFTHGTPFRRAWEEGLLLHDHSAHVGRSDDDRHAQRAGRDRILRARPQPAAELRAAEQPALGKADDDAGGGGQPRQSGVGGVLPWRRLGDRQAGESASHGAEDEGAVLFRGCDKR